MTLGLGIARADRWSFGELQQAAATAGWKELTRQTESPDVGPHWRHAEMVEMEGTGGPLGGACRNGQHTRSILAELGYDDARIRQLLEAGVALADG
jgi:crotonobetainyl-CoA:carnitine CoA-transferase CaiB-like acyl-CoA transferase